MHNTHWPTLSALMFINSPVKVLDPFKSTLPSSGSKTCWVQLPLGDTGCRKRVIRPVEQVKNKRIFDAEHLIWFIYPPSTCYFFHFPAWEGSTPTGSIVLVVMNELGNGAEQVIFCQVKLSCSLTFSDLVMLHSWILLPILARMNHKHKNT